MTIREKIGQHFTDQKIRQHFQNHRDLYVGIGAGALLAGFTALIMRELTVYPTSLSGRMRDATTSVDNSQTASLIFRSQINQTGPVTNNYYGVKRLSYITSQDGTDNWWRSQSEAAKALSLSEKRVSDHILHGSPLAGGISLTREGIAV